jgi:hypothetical protein
LQKDQRKDFEEIKRHLLSWMNDPSAEPNRLMASLSSKDLEGKENPQRASGGAKALIPKN